MPACVSKSGVSSVCVSPGPSQPTGRLPQKRSSTSSERAIDQFDRLYAEGEKRAKIFALAIHPYLSGQPHRIKYLEAIYDYTRKFDGVLYWNGEQILDWYLQCAK